MGREVPDTGGYEPVLAGEYLRASEQEAMAETIAKILYPEDNHYEGKSLRLKQQYFFVSATMQSIMRKHIEVYGTARTSTRRTSSRSTIRTPRSSFPS